jgi:hypothetical protein
MDQSQIRTLFFLDQVNHDELLSLLLSHFGHLSHDPLSTSYKYSKEQRGKTEVHVHVNRKGRISQIILSNDFNEEDVAEVRAKIRANLIENQQVKIAEAVLFAINNKVDGFFRYRDEFQILPVPEGSPKASQLVADHPFLLQFSFISSPDPMVNGMRKRERQTRIVRLLSFFTHATVRDEPANVNFAWIARLGEEGA